MVFRDIWSARTWLATTYVVLGLPAGIITFTVAVTGLALSVGLVPAFLVGLPCFWVLVHVVRGLSAMERARAAAFLEAPVADRPSPVGPADRGLLRALRAMVTSPGTWKEVAYALLLLPVGVAGFTIVVTVWSTALAGVTAPAYGWSLPEGGGLSDLMGWPRVADVTVYTATGVLALLAAPVVSRWCAQGQVALAKALLAPSGSELLHARVNTLQETRARVVDAADAERRRIERDLHDGAQQHLVSLAMNLGMAKEKMDADPEAARELITTAHQEAKASIIELRNVIRGVHPAVLSDRGLDAALSALAARSPIPVQVDYQADTAPARRPSPTVEAVAYFVVSEALTNAARHSQASRIDVTVRRNDRVLLLTVADDGVGGAQAGSGTGLPGLRDRVAAVDGTLTVVSPPGFGTTLTVELPCAS